MQPTAIDIQPQKMISILSIPGGFTISQWEPRAPNASDSISNPPSMMSSRSYLQNAQSFHSRNMSEFDSPSRETQEHASPLHPTFATVTSPTGRRTNPFIKSPDQNIDFSPDHMDTKFTTDRLNTEQFHIDGRGTKNPSPSKYLSPPSPKVTTHSSRQVSTSAPSPRAAVMSPVLCAIPEITNGQGINIQSSAPKTEEPTAENDLDPWIDNSPNDPDLYPRQNNPSGGAVSLNSDLRRSSETGVQSDSCSSVKGSESAASAREIDVFKHLFDDHEDTTT